MSGLSSTATAAPAGAANTGACQPSGAPDLKSFALYAEKSVLLDPGVTVKGGSVGVKDRTGPYLYQDFALSLMPDAKVQPGTLYAASVMLDSRTVAADVFTDRLVARGGTHGKVGAFPAMGPLPTVPSAIFGTIDLVVENHKTLDLASTAQYRSIRVKSTGVLRLKGGLYQTGTLSVESQARLEISAPVELRIGTQLDVGSQGYFGPATGASLSAGDLLVAFSGADNNGSWPVRFDAQTVARTIVLAPAATIHLQPNVVLTGALVGKFIWAESNTQVNFETGLSGCIAPCGNSNPWDDANACTTDSCDIVKGILHTPVPDGTACNDGNSCTRTDYCTKGACAGHDPVACPLPDQCHTAGTCDSKTGVCSNPAKPDGAACDDQNACTQKDVCTGGTCVGTNPKTCSPIDICHDAGTCDGKTGTCSNPAKPDGTPCGDGNACNGAETCSAGQCRPGVPPVVDDGNPCTVDTCDPATGVQHTPAPAGTSCSDGNACDGVEQCNGQGLCVAGAPPAIDDGNPCTADSCDPATGVHHTPLAAGTPCPDANLCNGSETCDGNGACRPGVPPVIDDKNPCTADSCDPATGVQHKPTAEGEVCQPGQLCDGVPAILCHAGACEDTAYQPFDGVQYRYQTFESGAVPADFAALAFDDHAFASGDAPFATAGTCPIQTGRKTTWPDGTELVLRRHLNLPAGVQNVRLTVAITGDVEVFWNGTSLTSGFVSHPACADSDPPSLTIPATLVQTGDNLLAVHARAVEGKAGLDLRLVGKAPAGPVVPQPPVVDDGNACTADSCDPQTGVQHTPVADGTPCSDGNACNGQETCQNGACSPGSPVAIDDGNPCTVDACDPIAGPTHVPAPAGTSCSDGNACNGSEVCDSAGMCVAGIPVVCPEPPPCYLAGPCDPTTGQCSVQPAPAGTSCSDGNPCNGDEQCDGFGVCQARNPTPPPILVPGVCQTIACDENSGWYLAPKPIGSSCEDGNLCNGTETCDAVGGCLPGTPLATDDGNPCTADGCQPGSGVTHTPLPDGTVCGTADLCHSASTCHIGACVPGTPLDPPPRTQPGPFTALHATATDVSGESSPGIISIQDSEIGANRVVIDFDQAAAVSLHAGDIDSRFLSSGVVFRGISGTTLIGGTSDSGGVGGNHMTVNPGFAPSRVRIEFVDPVSGAPRLVSRFGAFTTTEDTSNCMEFFDGTGASVGLACNENPSPDPLSTVEFLGGLSTIGIGYVEVYSPGSPSSAAPYEMDLLTIDPTPPPPKVGNPDACNVQSCDPVRGWILTPAPAGTACDDGTTCNGHEVCDGTGACTPGTPPVIDDGNPCTSDLCDPVTGVHHTPAAAGTSCGDGNQCNGDETCDGTGTCIPGSPATVDDGNPCTIDACDPTAGPVHTPAPVGTSCGVSGNCFDSFQVTTNASVTAGGNAFASLGVESVDFDWSSLFPPGVHHAGTLAPSIEGTSLSFTSSDGATNTATGRLNLRNWIDGPGFDGPDGAAAADLGIDDVEDFELNFGHPRRAIGFPIITGKSNAPAEVDLSGASFQLTIWNAAGDQIGSSEITLASGRVDQVWVTILSGTQFTRLTVRETGARKISDQYFGNVLSVECVAENACTKRSLCNESGQCIVGQAPVLDDGNPCTVDTCDPITGPIHSPVPVGTSCSDGNACNGEETCDGTGSCLPGAPPVVNDGNPCTADSCDAQAGVIHTPLPQGVPCGLDKRCSAAGTCDVAPPSTCVAPPQDMANWWAADGSTADRVGSSTAHSYGNVLYDSGAVRQAFRLDGLGSYVESIEPPRPTPESLAVDAWVFPETLAGVQTIASRRLSKDSSTNMGWVLRTDDSTGRLFFGVYQTASIFRAAITDLPALQVDTWQHVAGSFDANVQSLRIFVDGVELPSTVIAGSAPEVRFSSVVNGDFTLGNVGFTSDYAYSPGNLWPAGVYEVLPNPQRDHGLFSPCSDHTGGGGNMLVANGAGSSAQQVWCETIPVQSATTYEFSAWGTSVHPSSPATLNFSINGTVIGNDFALSSTTCSWQRFYQRWSSDSSNSAKICVVDLNTDSSGNDFALDDIFFRPVAGASIRIGAQFGDSGIAEAFWQGRIDETEIFDRALRPDEISGLFAAGSSGKCLPSNGAPRVFAGDDSTVSLPGAFSLLGTAADDGLPLGSVLTRNWTKVSGPGEATFTDPNSESTTVTFSAPGTYILRLTASDGELTAYDDIAVTALAGVPNQPPIANAGPDQVVPPPGSATLAGQATDDGLPAGSSLTVTWSKVSGPGDVVFADPHAAATTATFSLEGSYVLRLTASDGALTSQDDVTITVSSSSPENQPPTVTVSAPSTADLATGADLHGTASDDGLPSGILTTTWSQVSGPGTATFANANALDTHVMFSATGNFTLRLTASDGALQTPKDVPITVINQSLPNQAPVVEAGSDVVVKMPGPGLGVPAEVKIVGSYTDDGLPAGGQVTVQWGLLSGDASNVHAVALNTLTLDAQFSAPGEWELILIVDDGELQGYDTVKVTVSPPDNRAPVVNAGADFSLALAFGGGPAAGSLDGSFTDDGLPAGQTPTSSWSQTSGPTTCTISNAIILKPTISCPATGSYTFLLEVTDGAATGHDEVVVTVVPAGTNQAPVVEVGPDQEIQLPQNSAVLNCQVIDDGLPSAAALSFTWSEVSGPGTVVFADLHTCPTLATFVSPGMYVLQLSATDTLATTTKTVSVYLWDAPDGTAPEVAITAPDDGSSVTGLVKVKGTASDAHLNSWKVEQRAQGAGTWTTIATGTNSVVDGDLADFDPTLLVNGIYELRLSAVDNGGLTAETSVSVVVEGNQKVGNFTVSFKDLSVPVAGIPIEVIRTYDSRNKQQGDFGVGWTLDINTIKVQKTRQLGVLWQGTVECGDNYCITQKYCIAEQRPHIITITFSDGKVFKFQPTLSPNCQAEAPDTVDVSFQPMPGTTASLTSTNGTAALVDGNFEDGYVTPIDLRDQDNGDFFDPAKFRLTLHDGRVLDLGQATGLEQITDTNGNVVAIKATGIESSNGRSVTFTRDADGRITGITDPANHALGYTYDAAGDLVVFQDLAGNTTQYSYDTNHFLLGIKDARGIEPIQNQYDSNGRLLAHTDATGAQITYTHDLVAQVETVCDRLSHCTTYQYDDRGNVLQTVDALGNATTYEYDERDNKTKECNPLGKCTTYTYDDADNKLSETDALGHKTSYTYGSLGVVTSTTDPLGNVTTNSYDGHGNLSATQDPAGNVTKYEYDAKGLQTKLTDAAGNVATYAYDEGGLVIKGTGDQLAETDALGHQTSYEYDARGNRTKQTKTRTRADGTVESLVTQFAYDAAGRLTSTTLPDGSSTSTEYNSIGQQSATVDALGRRTERTYDDMGRLVNTKYPDGTEEKSEYDAEGHRTASIDRAGRRTAFSYDDVGRLLTTTFPDNSTTSTTYDAAGRSIATTDEDGRVTTSAYDDAGRRISVRDPLGNTTVFEYDAAGNQTKMTDPAGHVTQYVYDSLGRRTKTIFDDSTFEETTYDVLGRRTAKKDQAGVTTTYQYDALGRLTGVTDANGKQTVYGYDELGNQIAQTDAIGHATKFEYDSAGRRTKRTLPLTSIGLASETMGYDLAGQLVSKTDFMGRTIAMTYDLAGRMTKKTYPDGSTAELAYTPSGRRASAKDSRGTTSYSYDQRDRLSEMDYPDGRKLAYKWQKSGGRSEMTATVAGQSLTTKWGYDGAGRLNSVTDAKGQTYALGYDVDGLRTSLSQPNGTQTSYAYDHLHRLKELRTTRTADSSAIQGYKYTLGPTGIRTKIEEADGTVRAYGYDLLYRLVTEKVTGTAAAALDYEKTFTYDDVGNRKRQVTTGFGAATVDYAYDQRDRLLSEIAADTTTYGWDENGNMTSKSGSDGATYTWDYEDRMVQVTKADGSSAEYAYDVDGVRVQTVERAVGGTVTAVHDYLVDTSGSLSQVVAETDASGALVVSYVRAGDQLLAEIKADGSARYYHEDGLGSVRALTAADGAATDYYGYTAFGETLGSTGTDMQPYGFAGESSREDSGFIFLRTRFLQTSTGRFIRSDPAELPQQFGKQNLYAYVDGNPTNLVDPSGCYLVPPSGLQDAILKSNSGLGDLFRILNDKPGFRMRGQGIFLAGHSLVQSPFGHLFIKVVPIDQKYWQRNVVLAPRREDGNIFFTMGAGPSFPIGPLWKLKSELNRTTDVFDPVQMTILLDQSLTELEENDLIHELLRHYGRYSNQLDYDLVPIPGLKGWNSNSYAAGLLQASGIELPEEVSAISYPGWEKPVSESEF